jgi:nickel-dependent lactate racemase
MTGRKTNFFGEVKDMHLQMPAHSLYGNEPISIEFPNTWDIQVSNFKGATQVTLKNEELAAKIQNPKHVKPIAEAAQGCNDAVIIFDDFTRATPIEPIAKIVIAELEKAGVPRNNIRFIAATGAHRAMCREDFERKLGKEITQEFRIYSHNPFFNNVYLGKTTYGVPIELNAECVYAGFKIAIGALFPHSSTGVGGGGKIILPGIASMEMIRRWHLNDSGMWNTDSQARDSVVQAADALGLDFKIDVLLNGKGEIAELYAGHYDKNFSDNADTVKEYFRTERIENPDLVLANNYFKPTEPNVAIVQMGIVESVKAGGDVILMYNSPNGCACHYVWGKWGDTGIGGPMYRKQVRLPEKVNRFFVFSKYLDKGTSSSYHLNEDGNIFVTDWNDLQKQLGPEPRRVGVYQYADASYFEK